MLLVVLFQLVARAGEAPCAPLAPDALTDVPSPTIVVLGERHGDRQDLRRAARVVRRLARDRPVTVALEAVRDQHQAVLDRLTRGEIRARHVEEEADWAHTWRHDFRAYRKLLATRNVTFVAAGPPLGPKPAGERIPVPEAYRERLRHVALQHGMSEEDVPRFATSMAWRDHRIAELAVEGWSGEGVLVIVAGRGHVGGGLGITWQLDQGLADSPWHAALLGRGSDCEPGDRYLE